VAELVANEAISKGATMSLSRKGHVNLRGYRTTAASFHRNFVRSGISVGNGDHEAQNEGFNWEFRALVNRSLQPGGYLRLSFLFQLAWFGCYDDFLVSTIWCDCLACKSLT